MFAPCVRTNCLLLCQLHVTNMRALLCLQPEPFSLLPRMMRDLQQQYGGLDAPSRQGYTWRADNVAVALCRRLDQRFYRVRVLSVPESDPEQAEVRPVPFLR